jgi:hypothetical protein
VTSPSSTPAGSLLRPSSSIVSSLGTDALVSTAGGAVSREVTIVEGPSI